MVKALWEIVPLQGKANEGDLQLNLHPGQSRAWLSQRRFIFMLAGTQGG